MVELKHGILTFKPQKRRIYNIKVGVSFCVRLGLILQYLSIINFIFLSIIILIKTILFNYKIPDICLSFLVSFVLSYIL